MVSTRSSTFTPIAPHVPGTTFKPLKSYRKQQRFKYLPPTPGPGGLPYLTVAIQNGQGVRSHRRQRFRLVPQETSLHGLWGNNSRLSWSVPPFDASFDGNNALRDECTRYWYNVMTREANTSVEAHNQKLWAGEWHGHGRECGLSQTEYFSFTLDQFHRLNPKVYPSLRIYCGKTVDNKNARRVLDFPAFRRHLRRKCVHPAIRVRLTSFSVQDRPKVPHQEVVELQFNLRRTTSNVIDLYNKNSNINFARKIYVTSA